mmetsp:Transcript_31615/g.52175  ORF Transcript_31615/g.52175 Transcript_31615/m.52175 type:complete len:1449 (+) Transcript_31615:454-4800(+)|eukprot:CAMPEP_0119030658 /NCGR_PEP_ID=MMETSP1176-20130426/41140_1 /TAXON_ID=265551 /ORGANISM="Synedropsis recta cf, Strain CCMP1620" /LENGTH=1448 /DNA_ID=CAMNT_0006987031 /DNA_START=440 /DNA_END=4786 /DNA_ORIENTATION=-
MKSFRRLIPGRKKTKKQEGDLPLDSNSDHQPSPEPPIENSNSKSITHSIPPHAELPVIPQRRGNIQDVRFNTNSTPAGSVKSPHSNASALSVSEEKSPEFALRQDGTSTMKEQWHTTTGQNGNSASNKTTNMGDHLGATDRIPESRKLSLESTQSDATVPNIFDDAPNVVVSYDAVPLLEQTKLPRGGVSMETQAVGRVQFGIPPETIKDSMRLGLSVPAVYIVPVERFCREMGPALGVNLAEFEFPAYFNFFVYKKRCTLIVDSEDAEQNIRRVFSETLLGPAQFRREKDPIKFEEEDFAPEFPREAIPNFQKELEYFRIMPDGKELVLETLLNFRHFDTPGESGVHENLGIPRPAQPGPALPESNDVSHDHPTTIKENDREDEDIEGVDEIEKDLAEKVSLPSVNRIKQRTPWTYSQARWIGDVSTVWPADATEEQIKNRTCKRVEIFKMPGGTEYIMHDIDEENYIVGKARFSGHVKVSESMGVDGFGDKSNLDDTMDMDADEEAMQDQDFDDIDSESSELLDSLLEKSVLPPTFHPPSFGVTVLGNSHGFDKSGSVSGYVLWINGRGVMIDPPPYSSATLEREGIRPRTIVGIILTHCHADHDAGAFQKVLTGSPVVVITTPTIYKSFIRKYAALSALSPALLRHSHRHKPAVIGRPLRFQGATFHFTYSLHTIPCVGFRVEWRGRSMVFTGDHFNFPPAIDKLQESGVLSRARADDLRNLPLQETDLLLHEAGAPPIHTPLEVLLKLPERVKRRMYVVHTSTLPEGCELRVAPTGTAGTIRLDQVLKTTAAMERSYLQQKRVGTREDDGIFPSPWSSANNEYEPISEDVTSDGNTSDPRLMGSSFAHLSVTAGGKPSSKAARSNSLLGSDNAPPLVSLRPASSTDAWFILNLLSAVPFLTSLSYASTMEVLETARVDAYCKDDVIVPSSRRNQVLCVVWEGTCVEREKSSAKRAGPRKSKPLLPIRELDSQGRLGAVWHAGDWTGPISLQPDKRLSGESPMSPSHDVVAMSLEGVKVITVEYSNLHAILKSGSALYRKYLGRRSQQRKVAAEHEDGKPNTTQKLLDDAMRNLNVLELLDCNSALRKLSAVQKRHLESLAEGPISLQPGERLWRAGAPVDKAFVVISGTASFVPRRRNAGSVGLPATAKIVASPRSSNAITSASLGETMRLDAMTAVRELRIPEAGPPVKEVATVVTTETDPPVDPNHFQLDSIFSRNPGEEGAPSSLTDAHDYVKLSRGLQKRADILNAGSNSPENPSTEHEIAAMVEDDDSLQNVFLDLEADSVGKPDSRDRRLSLARRRSSRARFANKVLGRLYSRRAFTGGLIFSRGHFLGDVSKMVAGLLSTDIESDFVRQDTDDEAGGPKYGFGEKLEGKNNSASSHLETVNEIIHGQEGDAQVVHTSTLTAGKEGCVVLVFPKGSLIPFLDEYPGLLLSLLGTQVVV